jgi:hypothetical protein
MNKVRVFVSSTIKGMEDVRSRLRKVIENELGYEAILSEYEGSKPITPKRQCQRWAKECDIFIALIGNKYGWIIPEKNISVSEYEFNEALKDNPEKILVFVADGSKETRQKAFVDRVLSFEEGYYRRNPFKTVDELVLGIKEDIGNLFKSRLDYIRTNKITTRNIITPTIGDYIAISTRKRHEIMSCDCLGVLQNLGFKSVSSIKSFVIGQKTINSKRILFSVFLVSESLNRQWLRAYNMGYQKIMYENVYKENPNRFSIMIVLGNSNVRTLHIEVELFGGTCFKIEPGLFYGEGLSKERHLPNGRLLENLIVLSNVNNKEQMQDKFSEGINWIKKQAKLINFKRNYDVKRY